MPGSAAVESVDAKTGFVLRSSAVTDGGLLPKEFTGDGASATLPLEWSGVPVGTKNLAVIMHHIDPQGEIKWYWILYNIPPETRSLPENVRDVGVLGNNSVNGRVGVRAAPFKGSRPQDLCLYRLCLV